MENIIGLSTSTSFPDPRISAKFLPVSNFSKFKFFPHSFGTAVQAGTPEWKRGRLYCGL